MAELIKVATNAQGEEVVSARELYEKLGFNKAVFSRWAKKNIIDNPFAIENKDWEGFNIMLSGNETKDYAISIDFSAKLSMMARTVKGEELRNFFIARAKKATALEKQAIVTPSYQIEDPIKRAEQWIEERKELILLQESNAKLQFRSDFVDVVFDTDGVFSMEETCKILKFDFGRNIMMQKLREMKVLLPSNTPYQRFANKGYFKVVETLIDNGKFKKLVSTTYATSKGVGYLHKLFKTKYS